MIKKLAHSIREYRMASILSPMFVTLEVIIEVIIPYLMADIIDIGIANGDMPYVIKLGLILVIAAFCSLIFGYLSGRFAADASSGFAKNLRLDMFRNIQKFSFSNIDKFSSASLVTRMTTDVTNVQNAYQMIIRIALRAPIMLVLALILAFTVEWKLAMIFLVAIPILGGGLFLIAIKAHKYFNRVFLRYDRLNSVVQENVTAIRVVKSFVRVDKEIDKFKEISTDIYKQFKFAEKIIAFNSPLRQFVMYLSILLISGLSAQFIVSGSLTTGQLMSLIVYATQILSSLTMLSMVFVMIMMAETSSERIVEVLDEQSDLVSHTDGVDNISNGSVDFLNVDFGYVSSKNVLNDINIHIKAGETVGIIGGTGSSKSTLVSLIPRLYDATAGEVRVGGIDVRHYDLTTLRDKVAVVLQKNVLFSGTIKDNLRWGNKTATDSEMINVCKIAQANDFINSFADGYDTYIEQGGTNLSGGQKQRICLARAILKEPMILILDDSTSAVDMKTDALICKAFKEMIPDTTKFIIAQRVTSVKDADKLIVLNAGAVVGFGTPQEMLETNEIYKQMYITQQQDKEDENEE